MSNFYPSIQAIRCRILFNRADLFGVGLGTAQATQRIGRLIRACTVDPADMDSPHVGYVARSGSIYNQSTSSGLTHLLSYRSRHDEGQSQMDPSPHPLSKGSNP